MNRFFALAALVAGALAGSEDGGGGYSVPNYGSATAQVSSYMASPPMSSQMASSMMSSMSSSMWMSMSMSMSSSMMSSMMSSMTWHAWSTTTAMATPTAVAMTSSMSMSMSMSMSTSAAPSLITVTSVAMPTSTGWPKAPMATHTVMVGGSSLAYTPPSLSGVKDKDTIIFLFLQKNHTLTQSSFTTPCDKSDNGFKSGFLPSNGTLIPFIIVIFSDSMHTGSPMWFYCGQEDHCQQGMRFSINAPNDKDMAWRAIDFKGGMMTTSSMKMSMPMSSTMSMPMSSSMPMASASIVPGMGTMNNGQCMCDCLCGVNSFPQGAGMGMMGGMPGMIPAASAPSMAGPMSSSPAYGGSGWK